MPNEYRADDFIQRLCVRFVIGGIPAGLRETPLAYLIVAADQNTLWRAMCWLYCTKWKISAGKGDLNLSLFSIPPLSWLEAKISSEFQEDRKEIVILIEWAFDFSRTFA